MPTQNIYNIIIIYKQHTLLHSQDIHLCRVNDPLFEPIPKRLAYRNMLPDLMFMSKYGNRSPIYIGTWKLSQVNVSERNTNLFNKPQSQPKVYSQYHTINT